MFLYRQQEGPKQVYNILDGKQRLQTLILFISNSRPSELAVTDPNDYLYGTSAIEDMGFGVRVHGSASQKQTFKQLTDEQLAKFRDYPIATIEIDMHSEEHPVPLSELIDLFIDINSSGKLVTRFEMVKAMKKTPIFKQALRMIGKRKKRAKKAVYYRPSTSDASTVLQRLEYVDSVDDPHARVDRMWERLAELLMFVSTSKHTKPGEVLSGFIKAGQEQRPNAAHASLSAGKIAAVDQAFKTLADAYRKFPVVAKSRLAKEQPYFYTMATTLMTSDLIDKLESDEVCHRLELFAKALEKPSSQPTVKDDVDKFIAAMKQKTTDTERRKTRQTLFESIIGNL